MDETIRRGSRRARHGESRRFEDVLDAARAGESGGYEALFRLADRRVAAFARLRGAADPEGVVNEVFLQAFTHLEGFSGGEAAFVGWVFTIARNKLIDEARRRDRRPSEVADESPIERVGGDTEVDAVGRLSSEEAIRRLDILTADQRDVVLLRVVADLSVAVTAQALGKPEGAVKALQRRAMAALARDISSDPYPDDDAVRSS